MTTSPATTPPSERLRLPKWFLFTVLAILLVDRIAYLFFAAPLPDEGYYWLWGKHPALSYYDHPPLQAWLIGLSTKIFGHSLLALRAPTLLSSAIVVWSIHWWSRRARGTTVEFDFPTAVLVVFATPLFFVLMEIVFHDHLLIALLSLATILTALTFERFLEDASVRKPTLYGAAGLIGLAGLTKYNAVLFAIGIFLAILFVKRLRPMLRSPHLYLAALVTLACLTPVFLWNQANGDASFQYNLSDRLAFDSGSLSRWAFYVQMFFLASMIHVGPLLVSAVVRFALPAHEIPAWLGAVRPFAISGLVVALGFVLVLSLSTPVSTYWIIVAYVPLFPFLLIYFQRRWHLVAHLVFGTAYITLFTINFVIVPLFAFNGTSGYLPGVARGWPEISEKMLDWQQKTGAEFLATSDYRTGSILAFTINDPLVEVIATRKSQFTFWIGENGRDGQDAVILTEPFFPMADVIRDRFDSIEELETFDITPFGMKVAEYTIYLGRNYTPAPEE